MLKKIWLFLFMFLPSFLKVYILRLRGHEIGEGVKIGFVYFDVKKAILGANVEISNFNYLKGLYQLEMMNGSRIGGWGNWITSSNLFESSNEKGVLCIGRGSNITSRHYIDVQGKINIGDNTLIAGFASVFYTHGYTPKKPSIVKDISIGSNCYVSSHCFFLPGSKIADNTFVAANTTVSRDFSQSPYSLIAQEPAIIKKKYSDKSFFFNKDFESFKPRKTY